MKRSGRVKWSELRVGMVVLFGFAVLMWASFTGTGFTIFRRTDPLVAYFPTVNGLVSGAPVWMAGLEVGHVSKVKFVEKDGRVMVRVDFKVKRKNFPMINTNARASIGTMGLMGDKYVDVRLGESGAPRVAPGGEIKVALSDDLTTAFSGAPEVMDRVTEAVAELSVLLRRVNRGEGILGRWTTDSESSANVDSLVLSARELMIDLNASQKGLTESLRETSDRLNTFVDVLENGDGSFARMLRDSTLYVNLSSMSARAERLFQRLDEGEGTAGRLMTEDAMYDDVRVLLADLRALISDIKKNPKKYFKLSLF